MSVTKEQLAQYVAELGLPQEQTDSLVTTLLGSPTAATQFVGQRMRHSDYTQKTQELATHRTQLEAQATGQITQYAAQLAESQNRIATIMGDLEKEQISAATANARLRKVKETYSLSDADIPAVEGVTKPAGTADGPVDIDKRLNAFGEKLLSTIRQDMLSMPRITAIQSDIAADHLELTGKRLTRSEMNGLLEKAEKSGSRLEDTWKTEFKIDDLRQTKRDADNRKLWQSEWETEQRKRNSDDAMAGVRRTGDSQETLAAPILKHKFEVSVDPAQPNADKSQAPAQRLSGAERAAAAFLERRANGVQMGTRQA